MDHAKGSYIERLQELDREDDRPSVQLSMVLDDETLHTRLIAPLESANQARLVALRSSAVIELPDPRPYLNGQELLLITGIGLPDTPGTMREYVARLTERNVSALAIGLEPVVSTVPSALVAACSEAGLPLIAVSPEVPFAMITASISKGLENARARSLRFVSDVTRQLSRAAVYENPEQQLVEVLATHTGSWVGVQRGGTLVQAGTQIGLADPDELMSEYHERLRAGNRSSNTVAGSLRVGEEELEVLATELGRGGEPRARHSLLVMAKKQPISSNDRTALSLAATLLQLITTFPNTQTLAVDQLMTMLILDAPNGDSTGPRRNQLIAEALDTPRRLTGCVVLAAARSSDTPPRGSLAWWRGTVESPFVDEQNDVLRGIIREPLTRELIDACESRGYVLGISAVVPLGRLGEALGQARLCLQEALHRGRTVDANDRDDLVAGLVASSHIGNVGAERLRRLAARDSTTGYTLASVLRTWLGQHGSWDATARELGMHRNAVRRIVGRCEHMLGVDLSNAVVRAMLLLALAVSP